jgi:hypothetical protein
MRQNWPIDSDVHWIWFVDLFVRITVMGGKSRKSGGISLKLVQEIQKAQGKGKSCGSKRNKTEGTGLFGDLGKKRPDSELPNE